MFNVYMLRNPQNKLYVDSTIDVEKRIGRHNSADGAKFTKKFKNFKLVHEEKFPTLLETRRCENQLKGWSRAKKEALITGNKELFKYLSNKQE